MDNDCEATGGYDLGPKDWITTTLALAAFFISLGTAANNMFKKEDNLMMVVKGGPDFRSYIMQNTGYGTLDVSITDQVISFINQGNRPVEITGVRLDVKGVDPNNHLNGECEGDGRRFEFEVEPFSVKAGESVSKKFQFSKRRGTDSTDGWASVQIKLMGNVTHFTACVFISVALPDMADDIRQTILRGTFDREGNIFITGQENDSKPFVLRQRMRLGFW